jgi:prefoldin subunit 5
MINKELHVEDVIDIYNDKVESLETKNEYLNTILNQYEDNILDLKKEIDRLNEEVQVLNIELMKERSKNLGKI